MVDVSAQPFDSPPPSALSRFVYIFQSEDCGDLSLFVGDLDAVVAECVHRTPQSDPAGFVASLRRLTRRELKASRENSRWAPSARFTSRLT